MLSYLSLVYLRRLSFLKRYWRCTQNNKYFNGHYFDNIGRYIIIPWTFACFAARKCIFQFYVCKIDGTEARTDVVIIILECRLAFGNGDSQVRTNINKKQLLNVSAISFLPNISLFFTVKKLGKRGIGESFVSNNFFHNIPRLFYIIFVWINKIWIIVLLWFPFRRFEKCFVLFIMQFLFILIILLSTTTAPFNDTFINHNIRSFFINSITWQHIK